MQRLRGVPGGFGHPGHRPAADRVRRARRLGDGGAVTVEAAFALLALVLVGFAITWSIALLAGQLAVGEAARAGARVAARGEGVLAVSREARRLVPDGEVDVHSSFGHVDVVVSRRVTLPGLLSRWGAISLHADAVASLEDNP